MSQTTATASNPGFFAGYFNGNNQPPPPPLMSTMAIPPPPPVDSVQPPPPPLPPMANSVRLISLKKFIFFFYCKFRMVIYLFHLLLFQHYPKLIQVFHHHLYQLLLIFIKHGHCNGHTINRHNKLNKLRLIKINFINHSQINKKQIYHLQVLYHHQLIMHRMVIILINKIITILNRNGNQQVRIKNKCFR